MMAGSGSMLVPATVLLLVLHAAPGAAGEGIYNPDHVYVTRAGWEPDKGASAWLIRRFIDPQAIFRQVPEGEPLGPGAPFDVPESRFRRTHRFSAFETLRRAHQLDSERLRRMALLIHDLEINTWGPPLAPETPRVRALISALRDSAGPRGINIECGIVVFDGVYEALASGAWGEIWNRITGACGLAETQGAETGGDREEQR